MACKLFVCLAFALFFSFAQGELFLNPDYQSCIDLCSSCNGIVSFVNGRCECNIKDSADKGGEYVSRLRREASNRGLDYVSCKSEQRSTRCTVGLANGFLSADDAPIVAQYFRNDGPYQLTDHVSAHADARSVFIAPPYTERRKAHSKSPRKAVGKPVGQSLESDEDELENESAEQLVGDVLQEAASELEENAEQPDEAPGDSRQLIVQPSETICDGKSKTPKKAAPQQSSRPPAPCEQEDVLGDSQLITQPEELPRSKKRKGPAPKKLARPAPPCETEDVLGDSRTSAQPEEPELEPKPKKSKNFRKVGKAQATPEPEVVGDAQLEAEEQPELASPRDACDDELPEEKKPSGARSSGSKSPADSKVGKTGEEVAEAAAPESEAERAEEDVVGSAQDETASGEEAPENAEVSSPRESPCRCSAQLGLAAPNSDALVGAPAPMKLNFANPLQLFNTLGSRIGESAFDLPKRLETVGQSEPFAKLANVPADLITMLMQRISGLDSDNPRQRQSYKNPPNNNRKAERPTSNYPDEVEDNNYDDPAVGAANPNLENDSSGDSAESEKSTETLEESEPSGNTAKTDKSLKSSNAKSAKCTDSAVPSSAHIFYSPFTMVQNPFASRVPQRNGYVSQMPTAYILGTLGMPYFPNYKSSAPYDENVGEQKHVCKKSIRTYYPLGIVRNYKRSLASRLKEKQHSF